MICNECGKNNATVHVTHIINGKKTENHICESCAKNKQTLFNSNFSMENLFSGMLNDALSSGGYIMGRGCATCGMTYEQFKSTGKFGCSDCIDTFKSKIMPVIKSIQGHDNHAGKIPTRAEGSYKMQKDIEKLRTELKRMVESEEYERAADLRDKIRNMESSILQKD